MTSSEMNHQLTSQDLLFFPQVRKKDQKVLFGTLHFQTDNNDVFYSFTF